MRWLLAVALMFCVAPAWAVSCLSNVDACDQGEAAASAMAEFDALNLPCKQFVSLDLYQGDGYRVAFKWSNTAGSCTSSSTTLKHVFVTSCAQRNTTYPMGDAALNAVPISDCVGNCKVTGERFSVASGGVTLYGMRDRTYLGEACAGATDSNAPIDPQTDRQEATKTPPPECAALGNGQTGCVRPDGQYCATSARGNTFCWQPFETGAKVEGENAQVKGDTGQPVKPPDIPIPDKDWQRKEGHQINECSSTSCKAQNVTNFVTVPAGTAKNSTGDNKPDGAGNTSGNGQNAEDGKDSATDSGNCTSPPACVGDTLKCLHLKYTWKIHCQTKGVEVQNGTGCAEGDVPVCAGDSCKAAEYAQVLQQWRQRCAVEAMAHGNAERAAGINNGDDAGVVDGIWISPGNLPDVTLRHDLVQVGGSGPLLPEVQIEGQTWTVPAGFYDAIAAVRLVIIAMCTVMAMFIVGRNI